MRNNIEAERARLLLTKEQFSKKLGITSTTYRSYVNGGAMPVEKAVEMAKMCQCSVDYLLGLSSQRVRAS